MTVTLDVHYSATPYYSSGQKTLQIDWGSNPLPQLHSYVDLEDFVKGQITEQETFLLDGKEISIFAFVEMQYGWQIQDVFIGYHNGAITYRYLVKESHNYSKRD